MNIPDLPEQPLAVGTRVITPTGQRGVILPPPWSRPFYHLVHLDDGPTYWISRDILKPESPPETKAKKRKPKNKTI